MLTALECLGLHAPCEAVMEGLLAVNSPTWPVIIDVLRSAGVSAANAVRVQRDAMARACASLAAPHPPELHRIIDVTHRVLSQSQGERPAKAA